MWLKIIQFVGIRKTVTHFDQKNVEFTVPTLIMH